MKPSEVVRSNREEIRRVVAANRAANPRLFGSVLHGADSDGSDLDLLVDPLPGATLLDIGAIQFTLERSLGIAVDVLTPGDLPPRFRDKVIGEAIPL
jgi:predicted nucleotidyltransferase